MVWTDDRNLARVAEFHWVFGLPVSQNVTIADKLNRGYDLRLRLFQEEIREYEEACAKGDIVEIFDALLDIQYVTDGAFLTHGLHTLKEFGMQSVHTSNMTKLDENGNPIIREDGKILKSNLYVPPNLTFVRRHLKP